METIYSIGCLDRGESIARIPLVLQKDKIVSAYMNVFKS